METVFVNGLVIDGTGRHVERGGVAVAGGRITAVGAGVSPAPGPERRVVDLGGRTIMPGMIDTHCHPAEGDYDPAHEGESVGLRSLRSAPALLRTLLAGFTTVRSAGVEDYVDIDARDAINQGVIPGPRLLASGAYIRMTAAAHGATRREGVDGADEMRKAARRRLMMGADNVKLFATGAVASGSGEAVAELTADEMRVAVEEARRARKTTMAHAIGNEGIKNAVEAGVTSVDHGIFLDEEACDMMVARGTWYVPTLAVFHYYAVMRKAEKWRWERTLGLLEPHAASVRMAMAKGVKIAFGCDCGAPSRFPNGENAREYALLVEAGMPPMDAIVCGAMNAARLLRLDALVGSLEPGKLADLVVVDGNPLEDITVLQSRVAFVMREGKVYRDDLGG